MPGIVNHAVFPTIGFLIILQATENAHAQQLAATEFRVGIIDVGPVTHGFTIRVAEPDQLCFELIAFNVNLYF